MKRSFYFRILFTIFCVGIVLPLGTILSIWWPVVYKYQISGIEITPALVKQLHSRPDSKILAEIGRQSLAVSPYLETPEALHNAAENILRGKLVLPRHPSATISTPFRLKDLDQDGETLGLHLGSLIDVRILLDAYAINPREAYLATAVERYASFAKAESEAWIPHGFLWNDHAIAARISLSAELWRLTRNNPIYGPILENILPLHVWRSMRLLADPTQYTYATNHGVMQNVALLQARAAFPDIPDSLNLARLAVDRLEAQLGHYLSSEGMILEHSAGYDKHGIELLMIAIRSAELADLHTPDWKSRVLKARTLLDIIRRPDGSLPRFGNTRGDPEPVHDFIPVLQPPPKDGLTTLPLSGYAFWRDSGQTVCGTNGTHLSFAASLFPGHAHKLADEGSIMLWAGGRVWIDNTGYWPFGMAGRSDVDGWRGSNAPYLLGESSKKFRMARLSHAKTNNGLLFLEFTRQSQSGPAIDRQVIGLDSKTWLIVDFAKNTEDRSITSLWTLAPETQVIKTAEPALDGYSVTYPDLPCSLDIKFPKNTPPISSTLHGQIKPFGGWMMWHGQRTATTAIELTQSTGSNALLLALRRNDSPTSTIESWEGKSSQEWQAHIQVNTLGQLEIIREPNSITVIRNNKRNILELEEISPQQSERKKIADSLNSLASHYPPYRDYIPWRINATKLLAIFAGVMLATLALVFWLRPRWRSAITFTGVTGWTMVTLWLNFVYFR